MLLEDPEAKDAIREVELAYHQERKKGGTKICRRSINRFGVWSVDASEEEIALILRAIGG